ncbi:reductive dehalogenase [Pseudodesulfovibrio sp. JC047]|uniref:reductive dehalogenase n=1 Tax=Pseudodesulfovibrio sp. JC047 TaxID=2683199 RepID=UPI0013D2018D|nr:reductive dehalogenase [Pseudodesulfovibrio sp. JC047]NDV18407.1 reductive dehalogenase [Pseudodesulfovibrio sp. JC047]
MRESISRKKHYHSTVGRRTFMKMLGVGGGALGLQAATGGISAAGFKDLDDMMASPHADRNLPFWVREVDEPTVQIDWDNMEVFPGGQATLFNPDAWDDKNEYMKIHASNIESTTKKVRENAPGYSLRDRALGDANCWGWGALSSLAPGWTGPDVQALNEWEHPTMFYTPDDFGVPKYEGTPEENSRMLRVAGRILGAADMGFVKLNEKTKKLLYGIIEFEDVEKGYAKPNGKYVLPNKDLWVICAVIPQSLWMQQYTDRMSWACSNTAAYSRANIYSNRIKVFLRGLGYQHFGGGTSSVGRSVPFGIMAGMGEGCRAGILCSPQWGTDLRTVMLTVTDLPLAETKPIDAGIVEFCKVCKKCGEMCPSGAISMADEPFWGGDVPWQAKGYKGWYMNAKKCYSYMLSGDPDCSRCQTVCPFTKFDEAVMHDLVRMSIAKAPALNSIIRNMDDIFGYGQEPAPTKSPWDADPMDVPLFGLDKSRS